MELLTRLRCRTVLLKLHEVAQNKSPNLGNAFFEQYHSVKSFPQIPDYTLLLEKYKEMKTAKMTFKITVKEEFLSECSLNVDNVSPEVIKNRRSLVIKPIQVLQAENLTSGLSSITDELLSYLEPFPFDKKKILEKENTRKVNLIFIRNVIEKEYLAWKYQVDLKEIECILQRFSLCLYKYRSLRNLKKNISLLETVPGIEKRSVAEKIYHLNQMPFDLESVINFQDRVAGMVWHVFPQHCKGILHHSHNYILFVVSILQALKFTEKQIQLGLPFLKCNFMVFINKLNELLENSKLNKYRNEPKFLYLLNIKTDLLSDLVSSQETSFEELIQLLKISGNRRKSDLKKSLFYLVSQFYKIEDTYLKSAIQFISNNFVSEMQMYDTLIFLKEIGFTNKEVEESLPIVLYPRDLIAETFKKIEEESDTLKKIGFIDGCVSGTHFFTNGTKEKRKILQLCLYYMEKPFHFSGEGILVDRELVNTRTTFK